MIQEEQCPSTATFFHCIQQQFFQINFRVGTGHEPIPMLQLQWNFVQVRMGKVGMHHRFDTPIRRIPKDYIQWGWGILVVSGISRQQTVETRCNIGQQRHVGERSMDKVGQQPCGICHVRKQESVKVSERLQFEKIPPLIGPCMSYPKSCTEGSVIEKGPRWVEEKVAAAAASVLLLLFRRVVVVVDVVKGKVRGHVRLVGLHHKVRQVFRMKAPNRLVPHNRRRLRFLRHSCRGRFVVDQRPLDFPESSGRGGGPARRGRKGESLMAGAPASAESVGPATTANGHDLTTSRGEPAADGRHRPFPTDHGWPPPTEASHVWLCGSRCLLSLTSFFLGECQELHSSW